MRIRLITLPISLFISLRFIKGRRRGNIVSVIAIISILGIAISVSALIISLSIMRGFERELNDRILAVMPHGEIESVNQPWRNWNESLQKIEKTLNITAAPYIDFAGLIENGKNLHIIQIKGVNPYEEERISMISKFVQNNAWKNFKSGKQQIILGKGVANLLRIEQGDWISIMMIPNTHNEYNKLQQPKHVQLHVIGTIQLSGQIDYNFAIVPLDDARQYLDMDRTSITGIAIKVNDIFNAKKIVHDAGKLTNSYVYTKSWIGTYGYIYRDIQMVRTIICLSIALLMGISCLNITTTLVIAVKNKSSDIAILRTFGAKNILIQGIFIWYGFLIGMMSSLCGLTIGIVISVKLTSIISFIEKLIGHQFLLSNIYFIDFLPSKLYWLDILYVITISIFLSLLASWYPTHRAQHVDPTNILKH